MKNSNALYMFKVSGVLAGIVLTTISYLALAVFYGGTLGYVLAGSAIVGFCAFIHYVESDLVWSGWVAIISYSAGITALAADGLSRFPWKELDPFQGPKQLGAWTICSFYAAIYLAFWIYERDFKVSKARRRNRKY